MGTSETVKKHVQTLDDAAGWSSQEAFALSGGPWTPPKAPLAPFVCASGAGEARGEATRIDFAEWAPIAHA